MKTNCHRCMRTYYATINPDDRLCNTLFGGQSNFKEGKLTPLKRFSNCHVLSLVPVMPGKAIDVTVDGGCWLVLVKIETSCCLACTRPELQSLRLWVIIIFCVNAPLDVRDNNLKWNGRTIQIGHEVLRL